MKNSKDQCRFRVYRANKREGAATRISSRPFHTPFPLLLFTGHRGKFHRTISLCYKAVGP